jgi:hypothetical protein
MSGTLRTMTDKEKRQMSARTKKKQKHDQNRYRLLLSCMKQEEIVELLVGILDGIGSGASIEAIYAMNNLRSFE